MSNQSPESSLNLSHIYTIDGRPPCVAGTRWLTRFDKEVELSVRLVYHALTTGRGRSPPSQLIPRTARSLIPNFLFRSSDPDAGRGVHERMGASQVGTIATHPCSAHPPSHHPILHPRTARTSLVFVLPTVQGRRDCGRGCARRRG